jgi:hypothetical protein
MANALSVVQATFTDLDAQYNMLRVACTSQQQRDDLAARYAAAEDAYEACVDKMLTDDAPQVADLAAQLKTANDQVKQAVAEMGDMSKVIDHLKNAITIGAKMVAMIPA